MAEIHNISNIRIIRYQQREFEAIKEVLQREEVFDPTESYADMVKDLIDGKKKAIRGQFLLQHDLNLANREISYLNSQIHALKLEKINEKVTEVPDSAPGIVGDCPYYGGPRANCAACIRAAEEEQDALRKGTNRPSRG